MKNIIDWLTEAENQHFAFYVALIALVASTVEYYIPGWTIVFFPALIMLAAAGFMWNYPVSAIKSHGLFSEYLIELRLLWLVVIGLIVEYVVFGLFENAGNFNTFFAIAGLVVGLLVVFYARGHLQDKVADARGFK